METFLERRQREDRGTKKNKKRREGIKRRVELGKKVTRRTKKKEDRKDPEEETETKHQKKTGGKRANRAATKTNTDKHEGTKQRWMRSFGQPPQLHISSSLSRPVLASSSMAPPSPCSEQTDTKENKGVNAERT